MSSPARSLDQLLMGRLPQVDITGIGTCGRAQQCEAVRLRTAMGV